MAIFQFQSRKGFPIIGRKNSFHEHLDALVSVKLRKSNHVPDIAKKVRKRSNADFRAGPPALRTFHSSDASSGVSANRRTSSRSVAAIAPGPHSFALVPRIRHSWADFGTARPQSQAMHRFFLHPPLLQLRCIAFAPWPRWHLPTFLLKPLIFLRFSPSEKKNKKKIITRDVWREYSTQNFYNIHE